MAVMICFFSAAYAQDTSSSCNCSPRPGYHAPIGVMIDHAHLKGAWMVSYRYMSMNMNGNLMGANRVSAERVYQSYLMAPDKMAMNMHMLMIMYGVTDKITVMGTVNYISKSMDMSMMMSMMSGHSGSMNMSQAEMHDHLATGGMGDIQLYGLYKLLDRKEHEILLNAGLNIPAGSISKKGNSSLGEDQKYSYSMQTGSGTFSVLPGITYTGNRRSYFWGTQISSDIKTGRNTSGYRWGNELTMTGWLARNWNDWFSSSIRISGRADGKIRGFDREIAVFRTADPDADVNNSGGQRINAHVGINFVFPRGILTGNRIGLEYGLPVYQNLNGIQMSSKALFNAGWQYAF
jgi:hypothetical protein